MDGTTTAGCWIIILFARDFLSFLVIGINLKFSSRLTLYWLTNLILVDADQSVVSDMNKHFGPRGAAQDNHIHWIMILFWRTGCERLTHVTHVTSDSHSQSPKKKLWWHPLARDSTPRLRSCLAIQVLIPYHHNFVRYCRSNLIDRSPLQGPSAQGQTWLLPVAVNGFWGIINAACWYMMIILAQGKLGEWHANFSLEHSCGQKQWLG